MNYPTRKEERLARINAKLAHIRGIVAGFSSQMNQNESEDADVLDAADELLDAVSQFKFILTGKLA
jgi:hypothetical protein